jgi:ribosomal protein L21E
MTKKKSIREKGKIRLSDYFKKINNGDRVCVVDEKSLNKTFQDRIIGMSGKVIGSRGISKIVQIDDGNLTKTYIIHPINLKKLK